VSVVHVDNFCLIRHLEFLIAEESFLLKYDQWFFASEVANTGNHSVTVRRVASMETLALAVSLSALIVLIDLLMYTA